VDGAVKLTPRVGDKNSPVGTGIEVQIYASHGKPDNKLSDHDSGGIIPGIRPKENAARPPGEWNHFHIINQSDKLTVKLNGQVVNEVDLTKAPLAGGGLSRNASKAKCSSTRARLGVNKITGFASPSQASRTPNSSAPESNSPPADRSNTVGFTALKNSHRGTQRKETGK
jgi:hypothetical protein